MGITVSDIALVEKALSVSPNIKTVCELGSQNLYLPGLDTLRPPFASIWYEERGIKYSCIDLAGDNFAAQFDLAHIFPPCLEATFDLVTDFGTSEHVVQTAELQTVAFHEGHINSVYPKEKPLVEGIKRGYYACWVNKHNLLAFNGLMINVNPKTGNWPGHGYTYLTKDFYHTLADKMGYAVIHLQDNAAMGNVRSGWNVECILMKVHQVPFISFEEFQECQQLLS